MKTEGFLPYEKQDDFLTLEQELEQKFREENEAAIITANG